MQNPGCLYDAEGNELNQPLSLLMCHCHRLTHLLLCAHAVNLILYSLQLPVTVTSQCGLRRDFCMISGFPSFRSLRLIRVALISRMKYMSFLRSLIWENKNCGPTAKIEKIIINLGPKETDRFSTGFGHHCTGSRRAWELCDEMIMSY